MNAITRTLRAVSGRLLGAVVAAALCGAAIAGDRGAVPVATNADWLRECGSCHIPYAPRLLAAPAWRTMMQRLDRHFGVDASIDAPTAAAIAAFLEANAARQGSKRSDPAATRITEARWFRREHDEIAAAVWKRPAVGSAANCGACHSAAERGDFSERDIRIPR